MRSSWGLVITTLHLPNPGTARFLVNRQKLRDRGYVIAESANIFPAIMSHFAISTCYTESKMENPNFPRSSNSSLSRIFPASYSCPEILILSTTQVYDSKRSRGRGVYPIRLHENRKLYKGVWPTSWGVPCLGQQILFGLDPLSVRGGNPAALSLGVADQQWWHPARKTENPAQAELGRGLQFRILESWFYCLAASAWLFFLGWAAIAGFTVQKSGSAFVHSSEA